jgi:hypothetical protein
MSDDEARQAIIDKLTQPAGRRTVTGTSPGGWQSVIVSGGPYASARPETIAFLKERRANRHRLYAVSYTDETGETHLDILGVAQQPDGSWSQRGGAGGSGDGPSRDQPWANLASWWGHEEGRPIFCAGGQVIGTGANLAAQMQLLFSDGATLADTVDDGLVLFVSESGMRPPATARILASNGTVIVEYQAFPGFDAAT